MCERCDMLIDGLWGNLAKQKMYKTPDKIKGTLYSINTLDEKRLHISPQNIYINKDAFSEAIHFLKTNRHDHDNAIRIQSSNNPSSAGPLCTASRKRNNGGRCINYIIPILCEHGIVGISSMQPNKTWVIRCDEKNPIQKEYDLDGQL